MYKNILVAIDDSATSLCALKEATHIARASGAKLYIVHVADETLLNMHHHVFSHMADADNNAVATLGKAGQKLLDEAMKSATGVPSIASRRGDVPTLLEMMLLARNCPHRVGELGAAQIAAMKAYDWPRDRVELRETAARVDALLVHGGNLAAASAAIGQDYETYRRALARVGAITVRRRT